MESIITQRNYEVDVTKDDCLEKKKTFFSCVIEKKTEMTEALQDNEWNNHHTKVYKISRQCFDDNGLKECKPFFSFSDISY